MTLLYWNIFPNLYKQLYLFSGAWTLLMFVQSLTFLNCLAKYPLTLGTTHIHMLQSLGYPQCKNQNKC